MMKTEAGIDMRWREDRWQALLRLLRARLVSPSALSLPPSLPSFHDERDRWVGDGVTGR
jgi:hypothetical protein